ncbi:MAG: hypothetical protein ACLQLG_14195 [Thermoguttaceae bacterium]
MAAPPCISAVFQASATLGARGALRPCLAILLICVSALASFRGIWLPTGASRQASAHNASEVLPARFEPLQRLVPKNAAIGLLVDERYADPKLFHPVGRLWLARYALAPRPVDWSTDHALVIVDSGVSAPPPAKSRGWILVADLHNGVRLFRTCSAR